MLLRDGDSKAWELWFGGNQSTVFSVNCFWDADGGDDDGGDDDGGVDSEIMWARVPIPSCIQMKGAMFLISRLWKYLIWKSLLLFNIHRWQKRGTERQRWVGFFNRYDGDLNFRITSAERVGGTLLILFRFGALCACVLVCLCVTRGWRFHFKRRRPIR